MSILAEAVIAAFDSNAEIVWALAGVNRALAHFSAGDALVEITFDAMGDRGWRAGFDVKSKATASENIHSSIRVFSGVFQAVREFLEVRQPDRLVFASKEEALGRLYEEYLKRQGTALREMGYRMAAATKMSPLAEFTIEKTTPSEWQG